MIRRSTSIIYISFWVVYAAIAFLKFPLTNSNILFPIIPLSFAGAWLFGRTGGYIAALPALFLFIALNEYYADIYIHYSDRLIAPFLILPIVTYAGTLKENFVRLEHLNLKLDRLVNERNDELQSLTSKLLERSETLKSAHGQGLHDGMGQYITGIQLLCSSLKDQLTMEQHPSLPLAEKLQQTTGSVHNRIRRISRMHFPVRINEVGFIPALNELSSNVQDIKPIQFTVKEQTAIQSIPEHTSLQLYRICQETSLHAIDQLGADTISIRVNETENDYFIGIEHNGDSESISEHATHQLIQYRLNTLSGSMDRQESTEGLESTSFLIPKQQKNVNPYL